MAKIAEKIPELVTALSGIFVTLIGMAITYYISTNEAARQIDRDKIQQAQEMARLRLEISSAKDLELLRQKNEEERLAITRRREDSDKEERLREQELAERRSRQDSCVSKAEEKIKYRYESEQLLTAAFAKFQDDQRAYFVDMMILSDKESKGQPQGEDAARAVLTGMLKAKSSLDAFSTQIAFDRTPLSTAEVDRAQMVTMRALSNVKAILAMPESDAPIVGSFQIDHVKTRIDESAKITSNATALFVKYLMLSREALEKERALCSK